jgi:hypothetical protein
MASRGVTVGDGLSSGVTPLLGAQVGHACEVCGHLITRHSNFWCSRRCKDRAYNTAHPVTRQRALPFTPSPALLPPVQDQRLTLAEEGKLRGDNALVLRRLRQGPATTTELAKAAPRSLAIHSRVADVRAYLAGLGETVRRRRVGERLHLYWLEPLQRPRLWEPL